MTNRIFIADPACVLPYGHNPTGICAFTETILKYFQKAIPLVCKELPGEVEMPEKTDRIFSFYYGKQIKLTGEADLSKLQRAFRRDSAKIAKIIRETSKNLKMPLVTDPLRARALKDWKAIFAKYGICREDTIFFPCGDYYGVRGLFHYLQSISISDWPVIHIHLINVMEHESTPRRDEASIALFGDLLASGAVGRRVFVSTEVYAYAHYLSQMLMCEIPHVPFPPLVNPVPMPESATFNVAAIGSGRGDKGYFRLADIASCHATMFPEDPVCFTIQAMSPDHPEYNEEYEARLKALPNVSQKPHKLSDIEMEALYKDAHLLLLPYCKRTYQLRGSAVMSEGYGYGRPLLVSRDTAFENVIKRNGNGQFCESDAEFASAINRFHQTSSDDLWKAAVAGRNSFLQTYENGMKQICLNLIQTTKGSN